MAGINAFTEPPHAPRRVQLSRLAESLRGDVTELQLDLDLWEAKLTIARPGELPDVTVTCRSRPDDGGRLWFFDGSGRPIIEADNIADAALMVRDRAVSLR